MHYFSEYGLFLAQAATMVIAILMVVAGIIGISSKNKYQEKLSIKKINQQYQNLTEQLQKKLLSKKDYKKLQQQEKKKNKNKNTKERLFVLDFIGDIRASQVDALRREITAILLIAKPSDQVLLRLESPGGVVNGYGLAASQLERLKHSNLKITIAVDKVAASGGYMMAAIADTIIAAPFSIVGSIGVIMQLPNFNRLLHKNHIDYEQITAGKYKRTLTVFGENTKQNRDKMQADTNEMHELFKQHISQYRQQLNIEEVATGEHWFGRKAIELGLVDKLQTSDDFILENHHHKNIYHICYQQKKSLKDRLLGHTETLLQRLSSPSIAAKDPNI